MEDTSSQFDLIEKVSAGYVMNTIDFNKSASSLVFASRYQSRYRDSGFRRQ